ncbi:MAG: DUF6515 family protein [Gammaproteobacteria bacterium]
MKQLLWIGILNTSLVSLALAGSDEALGGPDRSQGPWPGRYGQQQYPARSTVLPDLPRAHSAAVDSLYNQYFYADGVWYAPYGRSFIVVAAPLGLFVPVLPALHSTL